MLSFSLAYRLINEQKDTHLKLLYTTLFYICLPLVILRLIWRGNRTPAYWQRWPERFGKSPDLVSPAPVIWIHAVSVGEVEASRPLVTSLQIAYPKHQLLITTMTPTGSERVKLLFSDTLAHCYLPYDLPFAIKRFLKNNRPVFGVVMETEIWPNLLLTCKQNNIPLVLANARMSDRSARGYSRFPKLIKMVLNSLRFIAAQSQHDRDNFHLLGADITDVHAIGNLKYEINLPASLVEQASAMRMMWDNTRPVWIAASTHEGEEEIILHASKKIRAKFPNLLLIIVPRHPERFDRVTALTHKAGFKTLRRSEYLPCSSDIQVLVIDTMGELPLFYATCDVAFVGGSLVPHGGHNILEPAALGRAIIVGPHFFNFNEITRQFIQAKAAIEVNDVTELANNVIHLLDSADQRSHMAEAGLMLIAASQGASTRLANLIKRHIVIHDP
ncbi:MAG: 3-deoxy-D-manno-octulosonic-acid transferase [Methylophagaceae bacterium]|jgi:3-deoxy-D-manno-octulosonic-acid transferase